MNITEAYIQNGLKMNETCWSKSALKSYVFQHVFSVQKEMSNLYDCTSSTYNGFLLNNKSIAF